jgi:hypothetical protein
MYQQQHQCSDLQPETAPLIQASTQQRTDITHLHIAAGLDQLQFLNLSGNQLQGSIPATFGPALKQLLLANNALSGKCRAATAR